MEINTYWRDRIEQQFLNGEKDALELANDLKTNYQKALKSIQGKLYNFYGKYQIETGLDMATIQKMMSKDELKEFKYYINEISKLAKENDLSPEFQSKLKALKLQSRITRFTELQTNIEYEVENLTKFIENNMTDFLSNVYEEGYLESIYNVDRYTGLSISFSSLNTKAIKKAISTPYMLESFSDRIWKNKESLMNILNQQIPQGIILGYNPRKVADMASKKLNTNYNSTVRLIRTEYNMILNDATAKGYQECGISRYQILATLDSRTSDICQEMDLQIFNLKDKEVGINYPPFHPNCRTTTIPYFEPDEFDDKNETRLAKDSDGNYYEVPSNLSYKEWKEGLVDSKGKSYYKP